MLPGTIAIVPLNDPSVIVRVPIDDPIVMGIVAAVLDVIVGDPRVTPATPDAEKVGGLLTQVVWFPVRVRV